MRSNKAVLASLAAAALIGLGAHSASANVLFQDNFNAENGGSGALNYTNFAQWNSTGKGFVDLIGNGFFDFYPGNGLYVDMDGSPGPGGLTTKSSFNLLPGNTYLLEFDMGGSQRGDTNTVDISMPGALNFAITFGSSQPLSHVTATFTVGSAVTAPIIFDEPGSADNVGLILDNVSLTERGSQAVPEPGSVALLIGAGMSGAGLLLRRRK